jgi:hypothetical protein
VKKEKKTMTKIKSKFFNYKNKHFPSRKSRRLVTLVTQFIIISVNSQSLKRHNKVGKQQWREQQKKKKEGANF